MVVFPEIKKCVSKFYADNSALVIDADLTSFPVVEGRWLDRDGDIFANARRLFLFVQ